MAIKGLFSKQARKERALQKTCARATNPKIKPDDRRPALHALLQDGGDEALEALFKRFTFTYTINLVSDEEEREMVYNGLAAMGDAVLPALEEHLKHSPTLSWGLRLLDAVCDPETAWQVLSRALEAFEPGYERDPTRKQQLIAHIGELEHAGVAEALLPFLEDHDETVRFLVVEGLLRRGDEQTVREPLLRALLSEDEESLRVKVRILEGLEERGWTVKGHRGSVERLLADELEGQFTLDKKGRVRRKKARG